MHSFEELTEMTTDELYILDNLSLDCMYHLQSGDWEMAQYWSNINAMVKSILQRR
jgi:hypothetical protein